MPELGRTHNDTEWSLGCLRLVCGFLYKRGWEQGFWSFIRASNIKGNYSFYGLYITVLYNLISFQFLYYIVKEIYTDHPMCLDVVLPVMCSLAYAVMNEDDLDMVSVTIDFSERYFFWHNIHWAFFIINYYYFLKCLFIIIVMI